MIPSSYLLRRQCRIRRFYIFWFWLGRHWPFEDFLIWTDKGCSYHPLPDGRSRSGIRRNIPDAGSSSVRLPGLSSLSVPGMGNATCICWDISGKIQKKAKTGGRRRCQDVTVQITLNCYGIRPFGIAWGDRAVCP